MKRVILYPLLFLLIPIGTYAKQTEIIKAKSISQNLPTLQTMSYSDQVQVALMPQYSPLYNNFLPEKEELSLFDSVMDSILDKVYRYLSDDDTYQPNSEDIVMSQFQILKTIESYAKNTGRSDIPVLALEVKGKDLRSQEEDLIAQAKNLIKEDGGNLPDLAKRKKKEFTDEINKLIAAGEEHIAYTHTTPEEHLLMRDVYSLLRKSQQMRQVGNELSYSGDKIEITAKKEVRQAFGFSKALPEFLEELSSTQEEVLEKYGAARVLYYLGIIDNVLPIMSEADIKSHVTGINLYHLMSWDIWGGNDGLDSFHTLVDATYKELNQLSKERPDYKGKIFVTYPFHHQEGSDYYIDLTFFHRLNVNSEDGQMYKH